MKKTLILCVIIGIVVGLASYLTFTASAVDLTEAQQQKSAADAALALPDFRAAERTFQLITQVAGRAGRAGFDTLGTVVVQVLVRLQVAPPLQVPHIPPQPSEPHCFPVHEGEHLKIDCSGVARDLQLGQSHVPSGRIWTAIIEAGSATNPCLQGTNLFEKPRPLKGH